MSEQTYTSDLRSDAKGFNRDKNNRVKWAHGQSFGPGRREEDARPRPARVIPHMKSAFPTATTGGMKARTALNKDMAYASGESSADEDVEHPSVAPSHDAEVAYSFDATRGPSHGSQILNHALEKAIEKYEVKETDKLIKNEYEVLDVNAEMLSPHPKKRNVAPEDEDYFFVDA
ncbi:hypothetical protein HBI56_048340 [Parastagonospora nodorum]|uniref:Uncharacterized protein n=2 Tax=Phaeosphaeria nodorum (strain SN15 / ATCC MYA-4574 / FGSC 10173) TaxID=321614 RepID=A0A7U2ERW7_PHANO|nr:hypothetical protein SNOG_02131 [Parastagonospora nodorum SN15]KAH3916641.1 hypothetical protein HBH56_061270 [Parastagonospora nodorum]EAT90343.1 hypothetical protein SNOG_02131 [Parastagonospora nodorum SN15]KAH3930924.1 hypothetical protein HBH54_105210 [Parastagonospora nodorum]KAH3954251.1 hypothetical protein HBH53_019890 [Parastagonospora nodorum]KAH3968012.1 hypothetical protein HBH51_133570 [Parastagonospora nodorum]